jgi:thymidylate synthase (FAD)
MSNVTLISVSEPKIEGVQTAEELIAYIARVSNPSNQANVETAPKLIKYLIRNHHWSPLEQVFITLEIETTRDIARQILRHRSFVFQEFSQRYADPTESLGFETREARFQDTKNRQNSIELDGGEMAIDPETFDEISIEDLWIKMQEQHIKRTEVLYSNATKILGIAKEQARAVFPEGLTKSRMYMTGSLRSWYHYYQLRSGNGTQKEHRIVAEQCWDILKGEFPATAEALKLIEEEKNV